MLKKLLTWDMIALILFIVAAPFVFGDSYFFVTINLIGIYAIAVIGLNLILGVTGLISMGHAAAFGLGAYFSAYISIQYGLNPFLSTLISCALVGLVMFILAFPLLRLSGYFLALGTLAIGVVFFTLVNGAGPLTGGPNGMVGIPGFSIGDFMFRSATDHFYLIWLTVFAVYIVVKNIMNSREGRALKAIHSDEGAAASFGVNVFRAKMKIFVVGSALGALGGAYYAHYMLFISPEILSLNMSIEFLTMGFIGGLGSYLGPILGAFVFQLIPQITAKAEDFEMLIQGIIFLLVVIFFRGGVQSLIDRSILYFKRKRGAPSKKESR